jgi:hypothetical protein
MTDLSLPEPDCFNPVNRNAPEADTGGKTVSGPERGEAVTPHAARNIYRMPPSQIFSNFGH